MSPTWIDFEICEFHGHHVVHVVHLVHVDVVVVVSCGTAGMVIFSKVGDVLSFCVYVHLDSWKFCGFSGDHSYNTSRTEQANSNRSSG